MPKHSREEISLYSPIYVLSFTWAVLLRFSDKNFVHISRFPVFAKFSTHLVIREVIILTMLSLQVMKLFIVFLSPLVTLFVFGPDIVQNTVLKHFQPILGTVVFLLCVAM
jgi:hypothetical protein